MANDCLVTKLKSVIDNNSLLELGEIEVQIRSVETPSNGTQKFPFVASKNVDIEVVGDGHIIVGSSYSGGDNVGKTYTVPAGATNVYLSNGDYKLRIKSKYDITQLNSGGSCPINLDDFKYSRELRACVKNTGGIYDGDIEVFNGRNNVSQLLFTDDSGSIPYTDLHGDIANLSGLTTMTKLISIRTKLYGDIGALSGCTVLERLYLSNNTEITGNISQLATCTALNRCYLHSTKVSTSQSATIASLGTLTGLLQLGLNNCSNVQHGTVEQLCSAMVTNGRTSGNLLLYLTGTGITYNGSVPTTTLKVTFTGTGVGYTVETV